MSPAHLFLGIFSWAVSAVFSFGLAALLWGLFRNGRPAVDLILLTFSWIFAVTLQVLTLGLLGALTPLGFVALALAGSGAVALVPPIRLEARARMLDLRELLRAARTAAFSLPAWLLWGLAAFALASTARFLFLIWALPPFVWDSLTYHLTNVAHWIQAGRIEVFTTPMARIYTPANYEALAAWFAVFLHHDAFIEAGGLPAHLLAVCAVYALIRGLRLSRTAAGLAALAYATTPALLIAVTGTKNDPHMAAYYLAILALVSETFRPAEEDEPRNVLGLVAAIVLLLCLSFGTKAYILHLTPGIAVMAALQAGRGRAGNGWLWLQDRLRRQVGAAPRARLAALALTILAGGFLGVYWNARNWILTGNPFYPYGVSVEGATVFESGDRTARLEWSRLVENAASLVARFGDRAGPIQPDLPEVTGWGWFVAALGLPASLWALLRRRGYFPVVAGMGVSLFVILFSIRPSPWNARYLLWFPALFCIGFAFLMDWLESKVSLAGGALVALAAFCMGLNFATTLNYNRVSTDDFRRILARPLWQRDAAALGLTAPQEYENALTYTPRDAVLGYNVHGNGFIYPLYRADFTQQLVFVPFDASDSCQAIAESMESRRTRYLFVAPEHTDDAKIARLRACAEAGDVIRERARGLYVVKREGQG